jgi:hypothetical protein
VLNPRRIFVAVVEVTLKMAVKSNPVVGGLVTSPKAPVAA